MTLDKLRDDTLRLINNFAGAIGVDIACGYDTEGNFIPENIETLIPDSMDKVEILRSNLYNWRSSLSSWLQETLFAEGVKGLEKIYPDSSGILLVEPVTKKLGLIEAAKAAAEIEKKIIERFPLFRHEKPYFLPVQQGSFAAVEFPENEDLIRILGESPFKPREIFKVGGKYILPARGRHHHISAKIMDDNILYLDSDEIIKPSNQLAFDASEFGLQNILSAFAVLRPEETSYLRTRDDYGDPFYLNIAGGKLGDCLIRMREGYNEQEKHLEFIAADANADPRDVAIISAISLVEAILKHAKKKGEALDLKYDRWVDIGNVRYEGNFIKKYSIPGEVPTSLKDSLEIFNTPQNRTFKALNLIAEEYLKVVMQNPARQPYVVEEATAFLGIGSRLFNAYVAEKFAAKMQEHGITPVVMEIPEKPGVASGGRTGR